MPAPCSVCQNPKAIHQCGLCSELLCKDCVELLPADTFSLLAKVTEDLKHPAYCQYCYGDTIAPALASYEETLAKAKGIYVFYKTQRKAIPLIRKSRVNLKIENCSDRKETLLRLGFLAAQKGFNSLVEVELIAQKVRNHGYQTSNWTGAAFPADVNTAHVDRQYEADKVYT